jgi:hypothetical protein
MNSLLCSSELDAVIYGVELDAMIYGVEVSATSEATLAQPGTSTP